MFHVFGREFEDIRSFCGKWISYSSYSCSRREVPTRTIVTIISNKAILRNPTGTNDKRNVALAKRRETQMTNFDASPWDVVNDRTVLRLGDQFQIKKKYWQHEKNNDKNTTSLLNPCRCQIFTSTEGWHWDDRWTLMTTFIALNRTSRRCQLSSYINLSIHCFSASVSSTSYLMYTFGRHTKFSTFGCDDISGKT